MLKSKIEFFLPMKKVPTVTHQEKSVKVINGKPHFYEKQELKNTRALFSALLSKHAPAAPFAEAVRLTVKWCFPRAGHADGQYKATRPDTDNLQKLLKDCMTETGFWKDDALVASEIAEKFYSEITGIYIKVERL